MTRTGVRGAVGALVCALGVLVCLGAYAPWVRVTILGARGQIDGSDPRLYGTTLAVLGGLAAALGLALIGLARPWFARPRVGRSLADTLRVGVLVAVAVVGAVGVLVLRHQDHKLRSNTLWTDFSPLGHYFNVHAGPSWGFWLELAGCAALVVVAVVAGLAAALPARVRLGGLEEAEGSAIYWDDAAGEIRRGR